MSSLFVITSKLNQATRNVLFTNSTY